VDVEHAVESSCQNRLDVEKYDLGLKLGDTLVFQLAGDRETTTSRYTYRQDVFFFNTPESHTNLVTAGRARDFLFLFTVQSGDVDGLSVGHHEVPDSC
jgi:hypothetical protein